jgi:hypothetical protein
VRAALDLGERRDLGGLLGTAFSLYRRYFWLFVAIAFGVVAPIQLIVEGVGLGLLTAPYDPDPSGGVAATEIFLNSFVLTPLITAMHVHAVMALSRSERPSIAQTVRRGLSSFGPVLLVVLAYTGVIALGFLLLILPGVYLTVRCYFVAQAVVADERHFGDAFRRSWEVTAGQWWRVLGILIVIGLILVPFSVALFPIELAAEAAGSSAVYLGGTIIVNSVTLSFAALTGTLLYFDLRARHADVATAESWMERPEAPAD